MDIKLANPRGFCAGVDRAIDIVDRALDVFGAPVYVRHEVVHNKFVVDKLRDRGAIFVDELDEIPDDVIVIFSAHGVSQAVQKEAAERQLKVFDATCPLVTKVHIEVTKYSGDGMECVLIGHAGHPEVEGTMGQFDTSMGGKIHLIESVEDVKSLTVKDDAKVAYVTQTTLSIDDTQQVMKALRSRFPKISGPRNDDICYATQNRQDSVKQLSLQCDLVLVVGSINSSNSNRLREIAERSGVESYLIDTCEDLDPSWVKGKLSIGITSGASAPEHLVEELIEILKSQYGGTIEGREDRFNEGISFRLPKGLR